METRIYFILGDFIANSIVGLTAAVAAAAITGPNWSMFAGMVVGMLIGMVVSLMLSLLVFTPLLGVIEVMVPCMLSGMIAGMIGGMWPLSAVEALRWGIGAGIVCVALIYALNAALHGAQKPSS